MYPHLFGINNFSYTLCMIIGIILAFVVVVIFLKINKISKAGILDLAICTCFAVASGVIFSILFENLYEFIQDSDSYSWTWGMTFYGGLFGGVMGFLVTYLLMRKNINFSLLRVVMVAPPAICIAHSIGRIGCFLAGCCYGKKTDSVIGIACSQDYPGVKVIPTQLFEAIFLFLLFIVMIVLLTKKFKYNFVIYMVSYSIFRFVIEYFRDDPRGIAFFFTPSQIWCFVLLIGSVPTYFIIKRLVNKDEKK